MTVLPGRPLAVQDLPGAAVQLDAAGRVVEVNAAAARLAGRTRADLEGRTWWELVHDDDAAGSVGVGWHRSSRLRSVTGVPEHGASLLCADHVAVEVMVSGRYLRDGDGNLTGAVVLVRPARSRRGQTPTGIEVISTVSHELRSPLTSVKGYTSLLLNRWDRLTDEQKTMMLRQVHHDADRVTRLVTELLDISRLETGRLVLQRQPVDVADLAASVVARVALEYPDLRCQVSFPADFPRVQADPDKVEQVLTNLVENAAKYADPTSVRLTGEAPAGDGAHVTVAVTDRGEGIPADDLPRVFTKFFRRDVGRPTGSGLGLWISEGLVEAHGGRLVAESVEGEGSTFAFTLPITPPTDSPRPRTPDDAVPPMTLSR